MSIIPDLGIWDLFWPPQAHMWYTYMQSEHSNIINRSFLKLNKLEPGMVACILNPSPAGRTLDEDNQGYIVRIYLKKKELFFNWLEKCLNFIYKRFLTFFSFFFFLLLLPPRCPLRKKRLTEAELCTVANEWDLDTHQGVEGHGVNTCPSGLSVPSMLDAVCEEMDQTTAEAQCEVARRRLQEIEDRYWQCGLQGLLCLLCPSSLKQSGASFERSRYEKYFRVVEWALTAQLSSSPGHIIQTWLHSKTLLCELLNNSSHWGGKGSLIWSLNLLL